MKKEKKELLLKELLIKELLIKDICGRLPYGVKCRIKENNEIVTLKSVNYDGENTLFDFTNMDGEDYRITHQLYLSEFEMCLYSMECVSEELKEAIKNRFCYEWNTDNPYDLWKCQIEIGEIEDMIDMFYRNHIDFRNFIHFGVAIDCSDMGVY